MTLEGFVTHAGILGRGTFLFTRYLISCCAADAQPLSVVIAGASAIPPDNQWADITARLDGRARPNKYGPEMAATKIALIKTPANTYESLR